MQYCDETELRAALPLDGSTTTADFADLITETSSRIDVYLGYTYGGARIVRLSSEGWSKLFLPRPGAAINGVVLVEENGVLLTPSQWELEADGGHYLRRLDAYGVPTLWAAGLYNVEVRYAVKSVPPAVREICIRESVRSWRSRQMGYASVIGAPGVSQLTYPSGFEQASREILDALKRDAGSGGNGWVAS